MKYTGKRLQGMGIVPLCNSSYCVTVVTTQLHNNTSVSDREVYGKIYKYQDSFTLYVMSL